MSKPKYTLGPSYDDKFDGMADRVRIAELEAELAPLEGRSAAAHMKYQGELETKVVKLTKERDKLREAARQHILAIENYAEVRGKLAALLEGSDE